MATPLNVTVESRTRDGYGGIQVYWWPADPELRSLVRHGQYFGQGYTETQITDYAEQVVLPGMFQGIDELFPGEFVQGVLV